MLPGAELLPRLVAQEAAYTRQRQSCIAARPGNPFGADYRQDGMAHGFITRGVPTPWLNRVLGATAAEVPGFAAWFRAAGAAPRFETLPGLHDAALAAALAACGCWQTGFDTITLAAARHATPALAVEAIGADALDAWLDSHLAAWSMPARVRAGAKVNMSGWLGLPGWTLLSVVIAGEVAGTAVLHVQDGLAYIADTATHPDFRRRGAQAALLQACLDRAARSGAEWIWSRCAFLSGSHRNMARAGLATFCTPAHWSG
jgi:ribosomal protein S18 acetylase RimI-like enzyme